MQLKPTSEVLILLCKQMRTCAINGYIIATLFFCFGIYNTNTTSTIQKIYQYDSSMVYLLLGVVEYLNMILLQIYH